MSEWKTKFAAVTAMVTCCGTAMLIAVGAVAVSGAWLAGGIAAVALMCVGIGVWTVIRSRHQDASV